MAELLDKEEVAEIKRLEALPASDGILRETNAPDLGQFNNPITIFFFVLVFGLVGVGVLVSFFGGTFTKVLIGAGVAGLGALIWAFGEIEHKTDKPREAGVITLWDTPVELPPWFRKSLYTLHPRFDKEQWSKAILVGGKVILADYPPFYLSTIKVSVENEDKTFEFKVMSKDRIIFTAKVSITACADVDDILDFIQAGNDMKKVFGQIEQIVSRNTQIVCTKLSALTIYLRGELVQKGLLENVKSLFEAHFFGTKVLKVQFKAEFPDEVRKKLESIKFEDWEREKETKDYGTMMMAAKNLQRELAADFLPDPDPLRPALSQEQQEAEIEASIKRLVREKKIPTREKCLEKIEGQRLIQDGKVIKVKSDGNGNPVINAVHIGGTDDKKKK